MPPERKLRNLTPKLSTLMPKKGLNKHSIALQFLLETNYFHEAPKFNSFQTNWGKKIHKWKSKKKIKNRVQFLCFIFNF